jgi:hypothetical protein
MRRLRHVCNQHHDVAVLWFLFNRMLCIATAWVRQWHTSRVCTVHGGHWPNVNMQNNPAGILSLRHSLIAALLLLVLCGGQDPICHVSSTCPPRVAMPAAAVCHCARGGHIRYGTVGVSQRFTRGGSRWDRFLTPFKGSREGGGGPACTT